MVFQYAQLNYPLIAQANFAPAKAEFEKVPATTGRPGTPTHTPKLGASGASGSAEVTAVGAASAATVGAGAILQHPLTRVMGHPFPNLIPQKESPDSPYNLP